jgi:hypothetical protein
MQPLRTLSVAIPMLIVIFIVVVGAVATTSFTQSSNLIGSNSNAYANANCSVLSPSPANVTYTTTTQTIQVWFTCSGSAAFSVTKSGFITPIFTLPSGSFGYYSELQITNTANGIGYFPYCGPITADGYCAITLTSGSILTLSTNGYDYVAQLTLNPYNDTLPTSIPGITVSWI